MKTLIASFIALLVGLLAGFYAGNRSYHKHIADEAVQQLVESGESSARFEAAIAVRSITLIDSGESSNAVQFLSRRIGDFYRNYAHLTHNDKRTKDWLVIIEQLASTNKVVADEIYAKHE